MNKWGSNIYERREVFTEISKKIVSYDGSIFDRSKVLFKISIVAILFFSILYLEYK